MNNMLDQDLTYEEKSENVNSAVLAKTSVKSKDDLDEGQLTLDIYQTDDAIVIKSTIAGVDPKKNPNDLDISLTSDMVTIKGRREPDDRIPQKDYFCQELYWGRFSRAVILPVEIDPDSSTAMLKNGILTIHLPKMEQKKTRRLSIS